MITSIADLGFTAEQNKLILEWYAYKVWQAVCFLKKEELAQTHHKAYDPLEIDLDKKIAHSYVFDFETGNRMHFFETLEDLEEKIQSELISECAYYTRVRK